MKFKEKIVTKLTRQRIGFIALLNDAFVVRKGRGACAYISITDVMILFEKYLDSNEPTDKYINRYVSSIFWLLIYF